MKFRKSPLQSSTSKNEDWTASKSIHSGLTSAIQAYNQLKNTDPESATRYNPAFNAAAYADAVLGAIDSINEIEDETQMAQKMEQYANLVKSVDNNVKSNYSSLMSLVTGDRGSLPSQLQESLTNESFIDDHYDIISQLNDAARFLLKYPEYNGNLVLAQLLYIMIDTILMASNKDDSTSEIMISRFSDAVNLLKDQSDVDDSLAQCLVPVDDDDDDYDDTEDDASIGEDPLDEKMGKLTENILKEVKLSAADSSKISSGMSLFDWKQKRYSYAERYINNKTQLSKYKKGIDEIVNCVLKAFPKNYTLFGKKTAITPGDIWAISRDNLSKHEFDTNVSYANKLSGLKQVGAPSELKDTTIWSGYDEPVGGSGVGKPEDIYVTMTTKGTVVSMFLLNPKINHPEEDE